MVLLPEALCEPLALALSVVEASSLLLLLVALAFLDSDAVVRVGWLLDCCSEAEAESGGVCQQCVYEDLYDRRTVFLSCENVLDVPQAMDVGEGVRHSSCDRSHGQEAGEQLRGPHCPAQMPNSMNKVESRARETAEGCGAEMCCGAGSATRRCWRVNERRRCIT